jgi:fermentation-respiration switch protein FrsA (DUF1100 family)
MALLIVGLPVGCAVLQHTERELVFRIEPGIAGWYSGLPKTVQEFELTPPFQVGAEHSWLVVPGGQAGRAGHPLPARRALEPHRAVVSYRAIARPGLLGVRHRLPWFGQSQGELPSETSVYEDARIAWERFQQLQPDPDKRLIYGHSLGGAVAIDLAVELGRQTPLPVRGLVIESTFTSLADVATAVANTSLPVRWLLSQKFDSIDKIADIHMPLLLVHGLDDNYVPPRFSEQLFDAAQSPSSCSGARRQP